MIRHRQLSTMATRKHRECGEGGAGKTENCFHRKIDYTQWTVWWGLKGWATRRHVGVRGLPGLKVETWGTRLLAFVGLGLGALRSPGLKAVPLDTRNSGASTHVVGTPPQLPPLIKTASACFILCGSAMPVGD